MNKRIVMAWCILIPSVIGWPLSIFWLARDEPPYVLSLSWIALILTAINILITADVKERGTDGDGGD
jgi:hypothetical protein